MNMPIQTVKQYIDRHHKDEADINYLQVALSIVFDPNVDPYLRNAMASNLTKHLCETGAPNQFLPSKHAVEGVVHSLCGEWQRLTNKRRIEAVDVDLAEWIIGKKVGMIAGEYIRETHIPTQVFGRLVLTTSALHCTLTINDNMAVIERATRRDPRAAYGLV